MLCQFLVILATAFELLVLAQNFVNILLNPTPNNMTSTRTFLTVQFISYSTRRKQNSEANLKILSSIVHHIC